MLIEPILPLPVLSERFSSNLICVVGSVNAYDVDAGAENAGAVYLFDLSHDRTALLLAGVQENAAWIIPLVTAVGIGLILVRRKYFH